MTPSAIIRKRTLELLKQAPDENVRISKIKEYLEETEPQLGYTQAMLSGALRDLVALSDGRITNPSRSYYRYLSDVKRGQMRQVLVQAMKDLEAVGYGNILTLSEQEIASLKHLPGLIDLVKLGISSLDGEPYGDNETVQLTLRLDKKRDTIEQIDFEFVLATPEPPVTPAPELEPADEPAFPDVEEERRVKIGKYVHYHNAEWRIIDVVWDAIQADTFYKLRCTDSPEGFHNEGEERYVHRDHVHHEVVPVPKPTPDPAANPEMERAIEKYIGKTLHFRGVDYPVLEVNWHQKYEHPCVVLGKPDGGKMTLSTNKIKHFTIKGE